MESGPLLSHWITELEVEWGRPFRTFNCSQSLVFQMAARAQSYQRWKCGQVVHRLLPKQLSDSSAFRLPENEERGCFHHVASDGVRELGEKLQPFQHGPTDWDIDVMWKVKRFRKHLTCSRNVQKTQKAFSDLAVGLCECIHRQFSEFGAGSGTSF